MGLDGFSAVESSVPHTRQRTASSLSRVPQVGQSFVVLGVVSGLIVFGLLKFLGVRPKLRRLYQCFDMYVSKVRKTFIRDLSAAVVLYSIKMVVYSLYIHIPFCRHRCAYCDFNTYAGLDDLIPQYVQALCAELEYTADSAGGQLNVHTIFFGGGTPSLLSPQDLERILDTIAKRYFLKENLEVSLEANPGTLSLAYLRDLRRMGINRLSIGMQSAQPEELRLLEREHDYLDVVKAVTWARKASFDNINLDLIFGLPGQVMETWKQTLSLAVGLQPEHLSLYALTLEHGTPMQRWVERGLLEEPDPDLSAEMYEWAGEYLESKGYRQYEISNWAKEKSLDEPKVCRHNLQYWRCQPYLGFGAGAHGYAAGLRIANILSPAAYIERLLQPPRLIGSKSTKVTSQSLPSFPWTPATISREVIDRQTEMGEVMMLGLRLIQEGVSRQVFCERFGKTMDEVFGMQIQKLVQQGLLEWAGDTLLLTPRGRLLGNRVFREFI